MTSYPLGIQRYNNTALAEVRGDLSEDEVEAAISQGADLELEKIIAEIIEAAG